VGYSVVRMIDKLEHKKKNDEDCTNNYFNVVGVQEIGSTIRRGRKTAPKFASSQPRTSTPTYKIALFGNLNLKCIGVSSPPFSQNLRC